MTKLMKMQMMENHNQTEFHGYVGHIAILKNGKSVRILGGEGLKLLVQALDGSTFECYHDNIDYVWDK